MGYLSANSVGRAFVPIGSQNKTVEGGASRERLSFSRCVRLWLVMMVKLSVLAGKIKKIIVFFFIQCFCFRNPPCGPIL